jgi:phage terminase small subunit
VVKKNPACDVAGSNFRDFMAFSSKFGLNPLFAGKVGAEVEDESEI